MNDENLQPYDKNDPKSVKKARENGKKGGKASGKKKREKKTLKELASQYGNLDVTGVKSRALLADLGIAPADMSNLMGITAGLFNKAMRGDPAAYNAIRDILGEKPSDKMEISGGMEGKITIEFVDGPEDGSEPRGVYTSIEELEKDIEKFDENL